MLDFLSTATIVDVVENAASSRRSAGSRKERIPAGLAIRLFRDGSIYPSNDLVTKFNLEYPAAELKSSEPILPKEVEIEVKYRNTWEVPNDQSNGFDIIDTDQYRAFQIQKRILLISPVSRKEGKIDLFASTAYDQDGTPKSSVSTQGAKTFGIDDLLPLVQEVYGIDISSKTETRDIDAGKTETTVPDPAIPDYVDLVLVANPATGEPWAGKPVTYIPKKLSRGKDAGTYSTQRRENPKFYALLPLSLVEASSQNGDDEPVKAESEMKTQHAEQTDVFS